MRISIKRFIISFFRFSKIIAVNIYRVRVKHTVFLLYVDTTFPYIFWNIHISLYDLYTTATKPQIFNLTLDINFKPFVNEFDML